MSLRSKIFSGYVLALSIVAVGTVLGLLAGSQSGETALARADLLWYPATLTGFLVSLAVATLFARYTSQTIARSLQATEAVPDRPPRDASKQGDRSAAPLQAKAALPETLSQLKQRAMQLNCANQELQDLLEELVVVEEELRQQNESLEAAHLEAETERLRYQDLFELAPDGYLVTNTHGKIQQANRVAAVLLGVKQKFLVGKPLVLYVSPQDRRAFVNLMIQLSSSTQPQKPHSCEFILQPRRGTPFPTAVMVTSTYDIQGNCVGLRWMIRDITDRKQLEGEALRASEAKLRSLLDSVPNLILMVDRAGNLLFLNRAPNGFSVEEMVGSNIKNYIFPQSSEELQAALERVFQNHESIRFEAPGVGANNTIAYYQIRIAPIYADAPIEAAEAAIVIATDITIRRQAELAVQESHQFTQSIADNSPNILYIYDLVEQRNIYTNREMFELLGYSSRETMAMGATVLPLLVHSDDLERVRQHLEAAATLADGEVIELEYRMKHADGKWRWLYSRDTVFKRDADGRVQQIIGSAQDISDRKQAEKALEVSQRRYAMLTEISPVGIFQTNSQGNWQYVNPRWCEMTGISAAEAQGNGWIKALHPDDRDRVIAEWQHTVESNQVFLTECRFQTAQDITLWVIVQAAAETDESGAIVGYVGTVTDITEHQQSETALQNLAAGTAAVTEQDFFQALVHHLVLALEVEHALVSEIVGDDQLRTLAFWSSGQKQENVTYSVKDLSLCDVVLRQGSCCQGQVQHQFPANLYCNHQIESYLSVLLSDTAGQAIGYLCIMDSKPLVNPARFQTILQIFAARATVELERQRTTEALRQSEQRFRTLFESAGLGIALLEMNGAPVEINLAMQRFLGCSPEDLATLNFSTFTHPEERAIEQNLFQASQASSKNGYQLEKRFIRKTGDAVWGNQTVSFIQNAVGQNQLAVVVVKDITERKRNEAERKQAEVALKASEARLRAIFDQAAVGITQSTISGQILSVNQRFCDIVGYTEAELLGRTHLELTYPDDREADQEYTRRLLTGELKSFSIEKRYICKDGKPRWVNLCGSLLYDESKPQQYLIEVVEDIQKRKRAETALRRSEERYELATRAARGGVWDWNVQTGEFYLDSRIKAILGYGDEEIPNDLTIWSSYIHPGDRQRVTEAAQAHLTGQTPEYVCEYRMLHKEGSIRWVLAQGTAVRDEQGQVVRVVGTDADITERKQAELQIYFQARLLDAVEQAVVVTDLSGNIIYWNRYATVLYGWSEGDVVGCSILSILAASSPSEQTTALLARLKAGESWFGEFEVRRKDGSTFQAMVIGSPIYDDRGTLIGIIGVSVDITERKQAELELQQAKEAAEAANRAKSQFLANMSHELRTPLNSILGFTQLLNRDPTLEQEHREQLGIVLRSGEHLLELINDVLEMSKIDAGRVSLNTADFDLYQLLDHLEQMLRFRADSKGLLLRFDRAANVPRFVQADQSKLRQILLNLVSNAVKFTQEGRVTLRVRLKNECNLPLANGRGKQALPLYPLSFEVEDTGPGIAAAEIDSLFDAFVQSEAGRRSQEGTGLGLAISRRFVELMGGSISVSSIQGQGTIFRFDIQVQLAAPFTVEADWQIVGLACQSSYRILVVEDQIENRKLVTELLTKIGFEVREAVNGEAAIAAWESWAPHLILMDIRMPLMDGYEAVRQIRAREKQKHEGRGMKDEAGSQKSEGGLVSSFTLHPLSLPSPKIIALTASAFEEERSQILAAGCDDYIHKPFKTEVLLSAIATHLGVSYAYGVAIDQQKDQPGQLCQPPANGSFKQLSARLSMLPGEWKSELGGAAAQLDANRCMALVQPLSPKHPELSQALTALINDFRFDILIDLTQ